KRIDGALQRSYLANVLRFYFERSRRYGLFDAEAENSFLEHVTRLEKTGLDFRANYEGYIVSLDSEPRKPLLLDNAKVVVLTARDFESDPAFFPPLAHSLSRQSWTVTSAIEEQLHVPEMIPSTEVLVAENLENEIVTAPLQDDTHLVNPSSSQEPALEPQDQAVS